MLVFRVSIPSVSRRSPDTGRLVAQRQAVAATIQASATTMANGTPTVTTVVANKAAGTTTAVARLVTTRAMIARRCGGAGFASAGNRSTVWSWSAAIGRPAPGPDGRMSR